MVIIIDYGSGNLRSVQKACEAVGMKVKITQQAEDINAADKIILPGVGSFDDAMSILETRNLVSPIRDFIGSGRPYLGICLGFQLLFTRSQEGRQSKGFDVFKGTVRKFIPQPGLKIPHMGWNSLRVQNRNCRLFNGVQDGGFFYFCHSYYPEPEDKSITAALCDYGSDFAAAIVKDNVFGTQFHPEKSQENGLTILKNFARI